MLIEKQDVIYGAYIRAHNKWFIDSMMVTNVGSMGFKSNIVDGDYRCSTSVDICIRDVKRSIL